MARSRVLITKRFVRSVRNFLGRKLARRPMLGEEFVAALRAVGARAVFVEPALFAYEHARIELRFAPAPCHLAPKANRYGRSFHLRGTLASVREAHTRPILDVLLSGRRAVK